MTVDRTRGGASAGKGSARRDAYVAAGVSVAAGDRAVELMRADVESTFRREVVGVSGDYSYGPFIMSPAVARTVVERCADDLGWGWRHFAFVSARQLRLTLTLYRGDFECPLDQRIDDPAERLHRVRQLEQNSRGLLAAVNTLY